MRSLIILSLSCLSVLASVIGCSRANSSHNLSDDDKLSLSNPITSLITVWINPPLSLRRSDKLRLHWKITNKNHHPVYVYSSLLKQPPFVEIAVDASSRTIEIRFTRITSITPGVNYFPAADFEEIGTEQSWKGDYVGADAISSDLLSGPDKNRQDSSPILTGEWRIRAAIAYGDEIDSVQSAIKKSEANGDEHPINPVVNWQKIQYSEYKRIQIAE